MTMRLPLGLLVLLLAWVVGPVLAAEPIRVAVAANFKPTAAALAADFEQRSGVPVRLSAASSGVLYAQILHGAPFDLYLSANLAYPQRLSQQGVGLAPPQVYAIGELVLWHRGDATLQAPSAVIERAARIALANPRTAPYGEAAHAWLQQQQRWPTQPERVIQGHNIGQVFQFVASGGVDAGFIAKTQWQQASASVPGQVLALPDAPVIAQAGLLLHENARAFWCFMLGASGREHIEFHGYRLDAYQPCD